MLAETVVKAGCHQYPIPLLNKITVTSTEGVGLFKSKTIYAGYKIKSDVGNVVCGNYNNYSASKHHYREWSIWNF